MKNKIITIICAVFMLTTCVSCGPTEGTSDKNPDGTGGNSGGMIVEGDDEVDKIELPDYDLKKDELEFLTTAYFSPEISEESMQTYMDCGFDIFYINGNNVGYGKTQRIEKALQIAQQKNIRCVIDATVSRDVSKIEQSMICNDFGYQNYSSLWAVNAFDEPVTKQGDWDTVVGIDTLSKYIPKFTSIYGEQMPFFINLNPLGAASVPDYNAYIKADVEEIIRKVSPKSQRWISCDSYVMLYNSNKDKHFLKSNWLCNLQVIAKTKMNYPELDIKANFYILSTPHQTGNIDSYMREIGYNELRLQMYSLVAFGYDMASYFTYATPPTGGGEGYEAGLVDASGNKTQRWNDAKRLNEEIHKFDHVFLQFKNKGVYAVDGDTDNGSNGSFEYLTPLNKNELGELKETKASADTLIGVGTDEKGNSGYTVVNYNDPYDQIHDKVTMTFEKANNAYVYVQGERTEHKLQNHTLELDLDFGEGVFVIPF